MIEGSNFSIINKDKNSRVPQGFRELPFVKIINQILGKNFFVSIVFITPAEIKKINKKYRNKNESTNILSFNLGDAGEIFLSIKDTKGGHLPYLLIHGLLHLKGLEHGSKMESQEKFFCKKFSVDFSSFLNGQQNNSWDRHRHLRSARGGSQKRNLRQ